MLLVFKHLLSADDSKVYKEFRIALDNRLKVYESPFCPPYSCDLAHEERLSPLIMWNAYYAGRCHNLLTRGMCLVSWSLMHNVDAMPEEVAWEVLLQVSKQTGEELWRTDVPGLETCIRSMFACRNFALESIGQPEEEVDDFQFDI